jgi:hypothetical protein
MIEQQIFYGEKATIAYLTDKMEPTTKEAATLVKVITPTKVLFLRPSNQVEKFNPSLKVGSILRRQSDGTRLRVRSIRKAEPHTGFSQVVGFEPQPMPLVPSRQPRKKKRRPQWFR